MKSFLSAVILSLLSGCSGDPPKPPGVPADARYASGIHGPGWVLCHHLSGDRYYCEGYHDETGKIIGSGEYVIRKYNSPGYGAALNYPSHFRHYLGYYYSFIAVNGGLHLLADGKRDFKNGTCQNFREGSEITPVYKCP